MDVVRRRRYRVLIKYCVFSKIGVQCVYTRLHAGTARWQVEHQRCCRTGRVQENYNILRKKTQYLMNTLYKSQGDSWNL